MDNQRHVLINRASLMSNTDDKSILSNLVADGIYKYTQSGFHYDYRNYCNYNDKEYTRIIDQIYNPKPGHQIL